jgi:hypothetical protein
VLVFTVKFKDEFTLQIDSRKMSSEFALLKIESNLELAFVLFKS